MSALWTAAEAGQATGGETNAPWQATGVSIDSRTCQPGDLFVALKGPHFDGHAFVVDALAKGAAAAMVSHATENLPADAPLLRVENTARALEGLGRAARERTNARIVAVTGSVGKTGVKEALRLVLGAQGACHGSEGNLNNHWGLPLSLARMPRDTVFGVFEMGMNRPGEIAPLSRLARPHVAVITTVAAVHSEFFDSEEEIADAKAEIFAGMDEGGTAILNRDNRHFDRLTGAAQAKRLDVIGFGGDWQAEAQWEEYELHAEATHVHAQIGGEFTAYRLAVPGHHWLINSLAVLATAQTLGTDPMAAARVLATFQAPAGRGARHAVALGGGAFTMIDESYNASPTSMRAAFETLGRADPGSSGRRIAVLGDMLELGEDSHARHTALAEPLKQEGIDLVFTAGPRMAHLWEALPKPMHGGHAIDSNTLTPLVTAAVRQGDVIMVKGSAGSQMGQVVRALLRMNGDSGKRVANGN